MSLSIHGIVLVPKDPAIKTNITDKGAWINFKVNSDANSSWNCSIWVPLDEKDKWIDNVIVPDNILYIEHGTIEYSSKFLKVKLDREKVKKLKKAD